MRGPIKRIFLFTNLFPWEFNDFLLKNTNNAIIFHFGALLELSKTQFSNMKRNLGAPKNWGALGKCLPCLWFKTALHQKPLNVITLGTIWADNINQWLVKRLSLHYITVLTVDHQLPKVENRYFEGFTNFTTLFIFVNFYW